MHKKIVSTCSPNNDRHWVCIQYIVKKFPGGYFFLLTAYVPMRDTGTNQKSTATSLVSPAGKLGNSGTCTVKQYQRISAD